VNELSGVKLVVVDDGVCCVGVLALTSGARLAVKVPGETVAFVKTELAVETTLLVEYFKSAYPIAEAVAG
jgi:hypothetical protein